LIRAFKGAKIKPGIQDIALKSLETKLIFFSFNFSALFLWKGLEAGWNRVDPIGRIKVKVKVLPETVPKESSAL
jgi:hypothetical protein